MTNKCTSVNNEDQMRDVRAAHQFDPIIFEKPHVLILQLPYGLYPMALTR